MTEAAPEAHQKSSPVLKLTSTQLVVGKSLLLNAEERSDGFPDHQAA